MIALDPKEYELTFESKGISYIFEDLVFRYYMPRGNVEFSIGGVLRTYARTQTIAQFGAEGLTRSPEEMRVAGDRLLKICDDTIREYGTCSAELPITKDEFSDIVDRIGEMFQAYLFFDPFYWDEAYLRKDSDANANANVAIVESIKNVAREKLNTLCFGEESLLIKTLLRIGHTCGVPQDELAWYGVSEILALFEAVRMADDERTRRRECFLFLQTETGERMRFSGSEALALAQPFLEHVEEQRGDFVGKIASKGGVVRGRVAVITREYADEALMMQKMQDMQKGDILVSETTDPSFMPAFEKASAVVTDLGGLLSHAAITAREMNIPCIVDTRGASKVLKTGDLVEVDAEQGVIIIIQRHV